MAYIKLHASILASTIWQEDDATRIVWFTLLAMADKNGEISGTVPGIAGIAHVPVESCRSAIEKFMSPDPDSRSEADEGRRLEKIDGGWSLINFQKYREMASKDDSKLANANRQRMFRERMKRNGK